jgi:hypothetical protein
MFFYTFIIIITVSLFYLSTRLKKRSFFYYFFFSLYLLLPAIIGGCRDLNVGVDLTVYGVEYWNYTFYSKSISDLIIDSPSPEYGYFLLNYICSHISKDIHFFLFVSEFVKILLVSIVALHFKKSLNPVILILTYMLFFYFTGLSMMRQQLALCVSLFSLIYYFDKKWIPFTIIIVIAWSFHNSAFIMFLFPLLSLITKKKYSIILIAIGLFVVYLYKDLLLIFISGTGLVKGTIAESYLDSGVNTAKTNILIAVFLFIYSALKIDKNKWHRNVILINSLICLFFLLMSSYFEVAFRVSYYQMIVLMIIVPISINSVKNINYKWGLNIIYISLYILHFFISATHGLSGTIPYKSTILGI